MKNSKELLVQCNTMVRHRFLGIPLLWVMGLHQSAYSLSIVTAVLIWRSHSCLECPGHWADKAIWYFFSLIFVSWRLIILQYCSGFCHTLTTRFNSVWALLVAQATCRCRRGRFDPWVGKIPWRRKRQPTLVFLPGKSHWQRSLAGYSPQGHKELDMS